MLCRISGYIYNSSGVIVRQGKISARLQQDIVTVEGQKVVPITISQRLDALAAPPAPFVTIVGSAGTTTYQYFVSAVDTNGGESQLSTVGVTSTGAAVRTFANYNYLTWAPVTGAATYKIYGRSTSVGTQAALIGQIDGTPQVFQGTPFLAFADQQSGTIGPANALNTNTSGGFVDITLTATVGASPAGIAYFVEYDPDPDDETAPPRAKDGYWNNYWAVPNVNAVNVGSFVTAQRGSGPYANYMPLGGTMASFSDVVTLGTASNTNKTIVASQAGASPSVRYNSSLARWEFSNNGSTFMAFPTVYVHQQLVSSNNWTIFHNKGVAGVSIVCVNNGSQLITPSAISFTTADACVLQFTSPQSGTAYVR